MRRILATVIIVMTFYSSALAMVLPDTLHLERKYLDRQEWALTSRASVNLDDFLIDGKPVIGKKYLESKGSKTNLVVGKQSYTLGDGLIAGISDVCGIRTSIENDSGRATIFYGNDGQHMIAGDVKTAQKYQKLSLEASYFRIDNPFVGVTVSSKLNKNEVFQIETSENLNTQAKGYLVRIQSGQAQRQGDVFASLSYRYVEPGAVSYYSADADLDDSKGIRLETTCKLKDNLALTLLQDFATTQDNLDKNRVNATLVWDF